MKIKTEEKRLALELAEINYVIKKRKYLNPLEFFKPLKYQELFNLCLSRIKCLFGGNRSGKTEEGAAYVILRCLAKPKQRWWACAETFQDSINIQQRKVWDLLPKDQTRYCYYDEVNGFRHNKIIFKNGSRIQFKSYDQKREGMQGEDCDGIWNDEEPPFEIYREQRMRLIDRDGEMIFTMTSLKGVTEVISELYEDHDVVESQFCEALNETLPRVVEKNGATFFMLWTTENPHINQARLLEDMKFMSRLEIKGRVFGIPLNISGRIYPTFSKNVHIVGKDLLPERLVTIYHVLDPHDVKPWAMQWWVVDKTGASYCVREYPWLKNFNEMDYDDKTYDDYADVIRATEEELQKIYGRKVYRRTIDPNFGNKSVQLGKRSEKGTSKTTVVKEMASRGFKFYDAIDSVETGHIQVRKHLHWTEKNGQIIVQPTCFVYELCQNTIKHLSKYSQKEAYGADGDNKTKPQLTQKWKDFADCTRYHFMSFPRYVDLKPRIIIPAERAY